MQITVDVSRRLHPTRPLLTGTDMPWIYGSEGMMDSEGRLREAMMARARERSPPVIRYMGGEPVRGFRWRQGVGPLAQRPVVKPDANQPAQRILFGTQEFLETCEALGSVPLIEVNMYEGQEADLARETADWVRYANTSALRSRRTGKVRRRCATGSSATSPMCATRAAPMAGPIRSFFDRLSSHDG